MPNGRGAWAYFIFQDGLAVGEGSGREDGVCNNRMEFAAAVGALSRLPKDSRAVVMTDSRILIDTALRDLADWKSRGWLRKSGRSVIFPDLMLSLDHELSRLQIEWRWVRAHSGNLNNEACDRVCREQLAVKGRAQKNWKLDPNPKK